MEPVEAAAASGDAVQAIASHFMLDMDTYVHGGSLGFDGVDFYVAGRGGVLGDAPASVVVASFVFWSPGTVTEAWERSAPVMSRAQAAAEFAAVGHRWGDAHLTSDAGRLADLAGTIVAAASVAGAPLFAGWRDLDEPDAGRPGALALHRMNALRELRGALHGAAVLTQGITPVAAVAVRSPYMLGLYGWPEPHPDPATVQADWDAAFAATDVALAEAYGALDAAERAEFVELANAAEAAVAGS
ncbi:MAG: hypothetical protein GXY13_15490 [Acidimicrobiales bacterium]|nr:hypothetical protein [Acidimicrobiales bacterium]